VKNPAPARSLYTPRKIGERVSPFLTGAMGAKNGRNSAENRRFLEKWAADFFISRLTRKMTLHFS
jgi:hypothetical protein